MGPNATQAINASLAIPATAQPIVQAAQSPLDAIQQARIPVNQDEVTFLQGMAPYWSDIQSGILDAYAAGKTPVLELADATAYSVDDPVQQDGTVLLTLRGPLP
jgi:hypothetical protein